MKPYTKILGENMSEYLSLDGGGLSYYVLVEPELGFRLGAF